MAYQAPRNYKVRALKYPPVCPPKYKMLMAASYRLAMEQAMTKKSVIEALVVIEEWAQKAFADSRKRVTDDLRNQMIELYRDGENAAQIAAKTGFSPTGVRNVLMKAGVDKSQVYTPGDAPFAIKEMDRIAQEKMMLNKKNKKLPKRGRRVQRKSTRYNA